MKQLFVGSCATRGSRVGSSGHPLVLEHLDSAPRLLFIRKAAGPQVVFKTALRRFAALADESFLKCRETIREVRVDTVRCTPPSPLHRRARRGGLIIMAAVIVVQVAVSHSLETGATGGSA